MIGHQATVPSGRSARCPATADPCEMEVLVVELISSLSAETWSLLSYVLGVLALCVLMLALSSVLGGRSRGAARNIPFESGVLGAGGARLRFSAKFYLIAMFFVIFDVEALFLYAWAIAVREAGWAGFIEAAIFIFILSATLVYLWRIGALDWATNKHKKPSSMQRTSRRKAHGIHPDPNRS